MKALQLHYTSCRRGRSGAAGFQTRTLTAGILPDEQREIERKGGYRPPRDFDTEPSAQEIAQRFPRALRVYPLPSGRLAVTLASYTGRDYSGRWGNFFSHTLVLEGAPPDLWPLDLFEWPGWCRGLLPEEDLDETPRDLPPASLQGIEAAESFRTEELAAFLREDPSRVDLLTRMARALVGSLGDSRPLVIRDTPTQGLYWLACLGRLFPPAMAWKLTWSTYQDDPRGCAQVNATTGDTDFSFTETEGRFRFYLFDLVCGLESEVPASPEDYPALAARWLAERPRRLIEFFAFLDRFELSRPSAALLTAAHLLELTENPSWPGLTGPRLAAMITLVAGRSRPGARQPLLEALARAVEGSGADLAAADLLLLLKALASEPAALSGSLGGAAQRIVLRMVTGPLLSRGEGAAEILEAWRTLAEAQPGRRGELGRLFLEAPLWSSLRSLPQETLLLLWRLLWEAFEWQGQKAGWREPRSRALLSALSGTSRDLASALEEALAFLPEDAECLARTALEVASPAEAGRGLGRFLETKPASLASAVRSLLDREGADELLLAEWRQRLRDAADPAEAFRTYQREVLPAVPRFLAKHLDGLISDVLDALPEERQRVLALQWLVRGQLTRVDKTLAGRCVELANQGISIDPGKGTAEDSQRVASEAAKLRRTLMPDRPFLRGILARASKGELLLATKEVAAVAASVPALAPSEYELLLGIFLLPALEQAGNAKEHRQLLLAAWRPSDRSLFARHYHRFISLRRGSPWPDEAIAALRFWLSFDSAAAETAALRPLFDHAWEGLAEALSKLDAEDLDSLEGKLRKGRPEAAVLSRWDNLVERVLEKKNTWLRRSLTWLRSRPGFRRFSKKR